MAKKIPPPPLPLLQAHYLGSWPEGRFFFSLSFFFFFDETGMFRMAKEVAEHNSLAFPACKKPLEDH